MWLHIWHAVLAWLLGSVRKQGPLGRKWATMEWWEGVIPDCRHESGKKLMLEELEEDENTYNRLHKSNKMGKPEWITDTESRINDTGIWKDQCEINHVAGERRDNRVSVKDRRIEIQMDYGSCLYMPDRRVRNKVMNDKDLASCLLIQLSTSPPVVSRLNISTFVFLFLTFRLLSITFSRVWSCVEPP